MKVLVTGSSGQLGYDILRELKKRKIKCLGCDRKDFDITDENKVYQNIVSYRPDVIIHCSAYTNVDRAEEEKDLCYQVNVEGTRNIAKVASEIDSKLVYISTDYVFDGCGSEPFKIYDDTNPVNYYGYTKCLGEHEIREIMSKYFIVRVSWLFGVNGNNFINTMLKLGGQNAKLTVINDQVGSPTYTVDVSKLIIDIIQTDNFGTYHVTNEGYCSWYDFACEIFKLSNIDVNIKPVKSYEFKTVAPRPKNSRLDKSAIDNIGLRRLPCWKDAVYRYLLEKKIQKNE